MKIFICDRCEDKFNGPLDEEKFKDIHGLWHTFDLCAPCRKALKDGKSESENIYFNAVIKKIKKA